MEVYHVLSFNRSAKRYAGRDDSAWMTTEGLNMKWDFTMIQALNKLLNHDDHPEHPVELLMLLKEQKLWANAKEFSTEEAVAASLLKDCKYYRTLDCFNE